MDIVAHNHTGVLGGTKNKETPIPINPAPLISTAFFHVLSVVAAIALPTTKYIPGFVPHSVLYLELCSQISVRFS